MPENKVLELRKRKGLTRQGLAVFVGATEEQILLIEKGRKPVRLDLALRISSALEASMETIAITSHLVHKPETQHSNHLCVW
jgi:DNA-binding XRE family transcriptional regulator